MFTGFSDGRWGVQGEGLVEKDIDATETEDMGEGFGEQRGTKEVVKGCEGVRGGEGVGPMGMVGSGIDELIIWVGMGEGWRGEEICDLSV